MLRLRKLALALGMSAMLAFSSTSVFAESLEDTVDLPGEVSINKLAALNVMPAKGSTFNPDDALTRGDFVYVLNRIMKLGSKSVKISDVGAKSANFSAVSKVVGNGLLKLDAKGNFGASKAVTYAEFSRALANGLGLKLSWTDRPVDFLFYLDRKGVLSIDTDLDAEVTRADAAVAIDHFIRLKNLFQSDSGVIHELKEDGIVLNNGAENASYKFAPDMVSYMVGQFQDSSMFQPGTPVELVLNDKGQIAFLSGSMFVLEEGVITYDGSGQVKIGSIGKNVNLNAYVDPLPHAANTAFTLKEVTGYARAGVTYGGEVYVNNISNEVTRFKIYMAKLEEVPITVNVGNNIVVDFSGSSLANHVFQPSEEIKITLKGTTDKTITLDELKALQAGNDLSATVEANVEGYVTAITVTATAKAAQ